MTTWIVNAVGLFVTTVGALLLFLYLWKTPKLADESPSVGGKSGLANKGPVLVAVGLLAAWFLIQCLTVILL